MGDVVTKEFRNTGQKRKESGFSPNNVVETKLLTRRGAEKVKTGRRQIGTRKESACGSNQLQGFLLFSVVVVY